MTIPEVLPLTNVQNPEVFFAQAVELNVLLANFLAEHNETWDETWQLTCTISTLGNTKLETFTATNGELTGTFSRLSMN